MKHLIDRITNKKKILLLGHSWSNPAFYGMPAMLNGIEIRKSMWEDRANGSEADSINSFVLALLWKAALSIITVVPDGNLGSNTCSNHALNTSVLHPR